MTNAPQVHFVSLGCPKNRVDSEVMLGHLARLGLAACDRPEAADLIVVNTCGFIDAAREESVEAIVAMAEHKKGRCRTLVVAGCLSQRHGSELAAELPEVDHFLGTGNFESIAQLAAGLPLGQRGQPAAPASGRLPILANAASQRPIHPRLRGPNRLIPFRHGSPGQPGPHIPDPDFTLTADSPRVATEGLHSRWLKVSEGCSNTCSFCIIPRLRGPQRSRPIADVVREAESLLAAGARELNVIAQDLCAYGRDLMPRQSLAQLLVALDRAVGRAAHSAWIRCLYAYPRGLTPQVIEALATCEHVVPYLDMPLQHISDRILSSMRRGASATSTRRLLARLRQRVDGLSLRTTFITGLPQETDADFRQLRDFVAEQAFEHMGVFTFSPQEGTAAIDLPDPVPFEVACERRDELMALQRQISARKQAALVGRRLPVLVEGVAADSALLLQGRHPGQAPQVDGCTFITGGQASPGQLVHIEVSEAGDYDVAGPMLAARPAA